MAKFYFTSDDHKRRFLEMMRALGKIDGGKFDQEYGAAVYLLTSSAGTWEKASNSVSRSGIEFEALLSEVDWSGAYSSLIMLAGNLFNERTNCNLVDLPSRLDDRNFAVAMTAFYIRRHSWPESEFH